MQERIPEVWLSPALSLYCIYATYSLLSWLKNIDFNCFSSATTKTKTLHVTTKQTIVAHFFSFYGVMDLFSFTSFIISNETLITNTVLWKTICPFPDFFISLFLYAHLLHFIFQKIKKKAKITWVTKLVITFLYIPGPVWKSNSPLVKLLNVIRDSFCKAEFSYTKRTRALLLLYMFNQEITKIEVIWQSETNEKIS